MENEVKKPVIGISTGDINGIGPEIILKTFADPRILSYCTPVIFASKNVINYWAKALDIRDLNYNLMKHFNMLNHRKMNVFCNWETNEEITIEPGLATKTSGMQALKSLKATVNALKESEINAMVTAPISKLNIQSDEFQFPGHSEFLSEVFGANDYLMLMVGEDIKVAVVTGHIPLKEVIGSLSKEKILSKLELLDNSLKMDFSIFKPRIAVLGLNPHAGEGGLLGKEDGDIIEPAINEANNRGMFVFGPYPADGFFGNQMYPKFDAVLAMYHDQGLTPFKTLAFEKGVNYTAGLPAIRTSPAHGTGFGIAGKNEANENSFREAVFLAVKIFNNRNLYKEMNRNPLKSHLVREKEIDN